LPFLRQSPGFTSQDDVPARPMPRGTIDRGLFRPFVIVKRVRLSSKRLAFGGAVASTNLELS